MGDVMAIAIQIIMCVLGTVSFGVTMNAPKNTIFYICIGGIITAGIERIMSLYSNDFLSCLLAMLVLGIYCEIIARKIKEPTTIILIPSTIPLLPGSAIYYTMLYAINGNAYMLEKYAITTLLSGLGIALGAILSSAITRIFLTLRKS